MDRETATSNIRRRRNNISRHSREQTPEPSRAGKLKTDDMNDSDVKNGSILNDAKNQHDEKYVVRGVLNVGPPSPASSSSSSSSSHASTSGSHAYRAKLMSKKEKSLAAAVHRSQSTNRQENGSQTNVDIFSFMRRDKRSLSAPRKREGSAESGKSTMTPQMQQLKISMLETENYTISNKSSDNNLKCDLLDKNLQRFDEERKQFELEKLKFLEDKRELDRLRLQRFERYKRELEAKRLGIRPNYDIDNKNDYMVARKVVIDYKMNDKLMADTQDSASDSEADITVVENLPTPKKALTESQEDGEKKVVEIEDKVENNEIKANGTLPEVIISEICLNGKEIPELVNGMEKSNDQKVTATTDEQDDKKICLTTKSDEIKLEKVEFDEKNPMRSMPFCKILLHEARVVWKIHWRRHPEENKKIKKEIYKCLSELILLMVLCGIGGVIFHYIEGNMENVHKTGVKRVKRDFIDQLWSSSHNLREDDWKSMARTRLRKFEEELHSAFENGMNSYSGMTTWNFVNSVLYCLTAVTTIGYGHISPVTTLGRLITIIYSIIGIPIFLILLADFGKVFTRIIKYLWVYVRRVYYTGSCRKVRKTAHAQQMMQGLNTMYEFVRKPSMAWDQSAGLKTGDNSQQPASPNSLSLPPPTESPMTPMPVELQNYEIDDEFNLPISVALFMLLSYMFIGAAVYCTWEKDWSFFEAFYFVFISMSTIGFGDFVPSHPIYMMLSIVYLIFGLALTSMCINVVQVKIQDHFRNASSKFAGIQMAEVASQQSQPHSPSELQSVQSLNATNKDNNYLTSLVPTPGASSIITDNNHKISSSNKML